MHIKHTRTSRTIKRQKALAEIRDAMGVESFRSWFDEVYLLRAADRHVEYEREIYAKLKSIKEGSQVMRTWLPETDAQAAMPA